MAASARSDPGPGRTILVTSALPYANGPIHIGHLVEYIQTDIWVRYQRLRGHTCVYVCAEDAHGTPIMLRAREDGVAPEELIERVGVEHRADFRDFAIGFDNYHTTHSEENRHYSGYIYERLRDGGHIVTRTVRQAFDPVEQLFLPDRFVRGTCPRCGAADQHGDSCEVCGATYRPTELVNPVSALSGATPVERESEHFFVRLADFEDMLKRWMRGAPRAHGGAPAVQPEIANKLQEWFAAGLHDWDISREAPYFGFEIPDAPGKYFYVWMDAPIGYMASFANLCARRGDLDFDAFWGPESAAELYHFIGKDIAYFHTLFWPAMLHGAGFRTPTGVYCHGFLTVNGQKMSKSRGTFIKARTYLDHLDPEYLRYYFAAKLGSGIDDIDLNLDDFRARVNSDLVGKLVNIASRCAGFVHRSFEGRLAGALEEPALHARFAGRAGEIGEHYERREFSRAVREVMALADEANQYIDERKPWVLARERRDDPAIQQVCTVGLNLFRVLMTYLKPVLPRTAEQAEAFLGAGPLDWERLRDPLLDHVIRPFVPLMTRMEQRDVDAMIADSREHLETRPAAPAGEAAPAREPVAPQVSHEEFSRLDLRVARIAAAEQVDGADKLLRLELDLGGERRSVLAGVRAAYDPEQLVGRMTVMVANLEPRRMRFGVSDGMVLAAGPGGRDIFLLGVDEGATPGMRVR